ncbi:MAG: exodeoxyribonuclease V subunit gamma [Deltaproteobacteria bacterium]|nr:exodeoxyribonuclease V subunit gamma [Deltaproteobacteria bacterium]
MDALASFMGDMQKNPMMPEWIGIQSRGMKQWISIELARKLGVCTNMRFLFPRQMVDKILTSFKPLDGRDESLDEDFLFWSVMKLINEKSSQKGLPSVEDYIKEDETGKKLYQLSMKIAKVFDDYQVYRPGMLIDWQTQKTGEILKDPVALWQAELWEKLVAKDRQNHIAFKTHLFLEKFSKEQINSQKLPLRMSLFGISALPAIFLQVFERISQVIDINLFLLAPSNLFFFDIKSERQIGKMALKEDLRIEPQELYYEMTNPLLSSLGTSGKAFFSGLEQFNYHEPPGDLFQDPLDESNTMLAYLQSDILNLVLRKEGQEDTPVKVASTDTSVCIHACHSPMREAQVLKDLLLNEFEKKPELDPHDIIVMMPDIEAYAPFIESVFNLENPLPFSISDKRKRFDAEPLDAFLKILALRNSRFEQACVLDLLLSESIARKFKITPGDITMIEKMVKDAKILWGRDSDHRKTMGLPPFHENTWQFGLQRLFMGMAMPEDHESLVQGILPCQPFEGLDLEVLGKFAAFCHALFSCLEILAGSKTIEKWCRALKKVSMTLMDRNFKNTEDFAFLVRTIDEVKADAQKAGFNDAVSFDVVNYYIEQKLDQTVSQGNFLAGNITFCNIMPMRSIPFKIVVLMGMGEKSFPRQAFSPGFNLIKKYPCAGDKIERDEDRYLFLEALLSARSKFIVTYTGMSIKDNSKIPCSGVVSELLETMEQSFVFPEKYTCNFSHPLHPFSQEYFIEKGPVFSFSKDNCNISKGLLKKDSQIPLFVGPSSLKGQEKMPFTATLEEMIRFFRNPVEGFVKQGLNIRMKNFEEQTLDREVFSMSGLDQYALGSFLIEKKSASSGEYDFYPVLKAMGSLPLGKKGKLEYDKMIKTAEPLIDKAVNIASKKRLPAVATKFTMDGLVISADFPDIREDGVYYLSYGKLNGARLVSAWVSHLAFNMLLPPGYPGTTHLVGRDPKGKKPVFICAFPPLESDAKKYFKALAQIYYKGMEAPFYFFCESSLQFVRAISKADFKLSRDTVFEAMKRSKPIFYGGYYRKGEKENRYVSLCVENNDPFESVDAILSSGFAQNSITIYKPLLENLKIIS